MPTSSLRCPTASLNAQPFLGDLTREPSAAGLFSALSLLARGAEQHTDFAPYRTALMAFHNAIAEVFDGRAQPLSWQRMLAGDIMEDASRYKFVLAQPRIDLTQIEPGG